MNIKMMEAEATIDGFIERTLSLFVQLGYIDDSIAAITSILEIGKTSYLAETQLTEQIKALGIQLARPKDSDQ